MDILIPVLPESQTPDDLRSRISKKKNYTIETKNLSYNLPSTTSSFQWKSKSSPGRAVLADVTCKACPGELTAIAGPSGAGKTTLLSAIACVGGAGRICGRVLVNGREADATRLKRVSGYVTQHDELLPQLTVYETLLYSARLKLRSDRAGSLLVGRVGELVKELGLEHVANRQVGKAGEGRGISGGERRRVSIGVELVHEPVVLFLDEPTSGLDSASALLVMRLLESMATSQGKTVILTIHQPGFRILDLVSRLILLSEGTIRHNASLSLLEHRLKDAGHQIPDHVNVLEFALDVISTLPPQHSPLQIPSSPTTVASCPHEPRVAHANAPCREVLVLSERSLKTILRTKQLFTARTIQTAVTGLGLGTLFMGANDVRSRLGLFAFTLTFLLSSTTEGLPAFLQERDVVAREAARGAYRVSSYVAANALVFLPLLLLVALLYSFPVYWMAGLRREFDGFLYFATVVWVVVAMANSLVAFFAALAADYVMGNTLIAGLMGAFFLFSGYFIAREDMPKYWVFMHYLSMFKYPFEALLVNQYGVGSRVECLKKVGDACALDGRAFLRQQGMRESHRWSNLGVMMCFVVGYRVLCYIVLRYKFGRRMR